MRIVGRIPVLPILQILAQNFDESRIAHEIAGKPIHERRKSRNRSCEHSTAAAQNAMRLTQRLQSVRSLRQVIQRPQHEHAVATCILLLDLASIAHRAARDRKLCLRPRSFFRLLDMLRHRIAQVHLITLPRQPQRMYACRAANIQNSRRRFRQMPRQHILCPNPLQLADTGR